MASALVATGVGGAIVACPNHRVIVGKRARVITARGSLPLLGALAIPAGTPHELQCDESETVASVFLDVQRYRFKDAQRLAEAWRKFVPASDASVGLFEEAYKIDQPRIDRRVDRALLCFGAGASLGETACLVRLSESRLTHLFREQIGMSARDWRRWLLMRKALFALYTGQSASAAAHFSGFADGAHLSRTCRALTGVTPSEIATHDTIFVTARGSVVDCTKLRAARTGPVTDVVATALFAEGAPGLRDVLMEEPARVDR
jgi:AraC-like DNA-binding protein